MSDDYEARMLHVEETGYLGCESFLTTSDSSSRNIPHAEAMAATTLAAWNMPKLCEHECVADNCVRIVQNVQHCLPAQRIS